MGVDKEYLDRQLTSADPVDRKSSVRFATTTALPAYARVGNVITASANGALPAIDGVVPVQGNSLLLTDDGTASNIDNGIYEITQLGSGGTPFILTRRGDANADDLVNSGMRVAVEEGTQYQSGTEFVLVTPNPITLNVTPLDIVVVESGGGAAFTYVNSPKKVPSNSAVFYSEDVVVDTDGDVAIEGDLHPVWEVPNHSVLRLPPRNMHVVQENEEMLVTDDMVIEGVLVVDGQVTNVTPYTLSQIQTLLGTDPVGSRAAIGAAASVDLTPLQQQAHDTALAGTVQTTNATPTTIASYTTLANSRAIVMRYNVFGYDTANDFVGHFIAEVTVKRDSVSTLTISEELVLKTFKDNLNWDVNVNVNGLALDIDVTGDVGNTVEWRCIGGVSEHG